MDCQRLDDFYELYLLGFGCEGGPKGDDAAEIAEHVERGCPYCLEHLREAAEVVSLLARTLRPSRANPPGRVDPKRRAELVRRARKLKPGD